MPFTLAAVLVVSQLVATTPEVLPLERGWRVGAEPTTHCLSTAEKDLATQLRDAGWSPGASRGTWVRHGTALVLDEVRVGTWPLTTLGSIEEQRRWERCENVGRTRVTARLGPGASR